MWKIYNQINEQKHEPEILLYDTIAHFDDKNSGYVSAKNLINQIRALKDVKNITLRINSNGGDIFQALAIYNTLKEHEANITVKVDGIAASAASIIAMAGDKIIMPENSMLMLHNPWGYEVGDADKMRAYAETLDKIKNMCVNIYSVKSNLKAEQISEIMDNESYLSADECKKLGFCDEVSEKIDVAAQMKDFHGIRDSLTETEIEKIRNEGKIQERARLKALDELKAPGREEIINKAKYEEPQNANDIALELLKADNVQEKLNSRMQDSQEINNVSPSHDIGVQAMQNIIDSITINLNRMRGYENVR